MSKLEGADGMRRNEESMKAVLYCKRKFGIILLCVFSLPTVLPLWFIITGSFMGSGEFTANFSAVLEETTGKVFWPFFPAYPTLRYYVELLMDTPSFLVVFWNSCKQVFPSLIGQLLIAVPAAWSFARFNFKGKKAVFTIYIILMIMPFQVTMVSSYLVLDSINLLDSHLTIILPAAFSTFPVFIMVKFFKSIPRSIIDAAKIDGAGEGRIFWSIGIPLGRGGIISVMILDFLELFNAIEQPLNFIKTPSLMPMTLYLPGVSAG
ncbi:MAG TPA: carbohydrate ABC transporter permease, partial [Mobilitalea sp.]|nr:carbohydrate ABC transporter permease [Mobilitalea sp.]